MRRVSAGHTRLVCCLVVVWVAWAGPWLAPASAAPYTVSLKYGAAPGCPDATDFRAAVIARLGYDPFKDDAPERVLVQIRPRGASLEGRIEWRDAEGQWAGDQRFPLGRTNCLQLARAMAFALALQIQFLAKAEAPPPALPPASATTTETPAPAEPSKPAPAPPETPSAVMAPAAVETVPPAVAGVPLPLPLPSPTPEPGPILALGAGAAVGAGMSSSPVVLGRAFGALAWQRLSVELALVISVPSVSRRADGAGFSQQYFFVSAASCGALSNLSRWRACLLVNGGGVRLMGRDIDLPTSATVPLVEAGARLGFIQNLGGRVFLDAHVDGVMRLTRWIGRLDQVPVWSAPPVAATIGVDAGVRFP